MGLRLTIILPAAIAPLLLGGPLTSSADRVEKALLGVYVQDEADFEYLRAEGIPVFAKLNSAKGPLLLVGAGAAGGEALRARGLDAVALHPDVEDKAFYVVYRMPGLKVVDLESYGSVVYEDEVLAVIQMSPGRAERLAEAGGEIRAVTFDPKPLSAFREERVGPATVTPHPAIQGMIDKVDSATVYSYTGDLSGEWPAMIGGSPYTIATRHTYSGTPIDKATQYVGEHLEALGMTVEYHEWSDPTYPNVIGELPGVVSPDSVVIICGHLDDMPSGPLAPGADDNASGTVGVLVAADILIQYSWRYTIRFALWTGEEQGLLGSHYYAQRCYSLSEPIVGVLNLDMIAHNTVGSGWDIDIHANESMSETLDLAQLFADVVGAYGLGVNPQIVPDGIGASDHASFWDYGYSAVLGIEDLADFNPNYHTTSDLLPNLDMKFYVEFVKASVATCAHMAGLQEESAPVPSLAAPAAALLAALLASLGMHAVKVKSRRIDCPL